MITLPLTKDIAIPTLGFGTWKLVDDEAIRSVEKALEVGYRHIDTADAYGNHKQIAKAIKSSGIKREDLFLTTKVWRLNANKKAVEESVDRFLEELQTDYIDLLLFHWPNREVSIQETLVAMDKARLKKKVKAIGVSNFTVHHLEDALETGIEFSNNQVEIHPTLSQPQLRKFCQDHKILVTAYSPIGRGEDVNLEVIQNLANKYSVSPSQVILGWIRQSGMVAIPKAANPKHIAENFKSLDLQLSTEDLEQIDTLNRGNRMGKPEWAHFDY